ncbi:hypothetical protein AIOL_001465 [Candidatus Rhodobacter oscarellae]|uniref:Transmembrane protein n=1 Tax=Candidatus Rhodobacter oscarellae TaxID=1675527 RepID=A0A0J9E0P5_9RHOB|nr:DUF6653 family protein [Candidatus Rhodobacter lobularis]KMW56511.1 hypothetical protein AIOL_001465 [Candidatus Rhodobacter lobularis]
MDLMKRAERMMSMDDRTWRRHCNPWSGWTRMLTALPLLVLAVWSRVWLGWGALIPIFLALAWIWWNPRAFREPKRFDAWMSRGVLGERVYLEHRSEIAAHHRRAALVLALLSLPGALVMIWGLIALWWEGAVFGAILAGLPKIWFVDRMVWIFEDWRREGRDVPGMNAHEL